MTLEQRLRHTAEEIDRAVAGRRMPLPLSAAGRRPFIGPVVAMLTALAILVPVVILSSLVFSAPSDQPVEPAASPETAPTADAVPAIPSTIPNASSTPESDGLSQADSLPDDWAMPLGEDAVLLLAEEGIVLTAAPSEGFDGAMFDMTWASGEAIAGGPGPMSVAVAGKLPQTVVWVLDDSSAKSTIFGIVPAGTTHAEVAARGLPHVETDRVFERPEIDAAVFIATVANSEPSVDDVWEVTITNSGTETTIPLEADTEPLNDSPDGVISLRMLLPKQPLIVGSTTVDSLPEAIACQAPEDITAPPNRKGSAADIGAFDTPEEVLEAFLDSFSTAPPLAMSGYHELTTDAGTIGYGVEFEGGPGYVTVVSLVESNDGWIIDGWEASGC